jgi:hypothetical protein
MFGSTFNTSNTLKERNEILERENEFLDWVEFMQTQPKKEVSIPMVQNQYLITWEERAINKIKAAIKDFMKSRENQKVHV